MRVSTATSAEDEPEMPEKNMLNTVTTCARPPRRWPTSACDKVAMRTTTLAEVISSPTSRKNGTASSASESTPLNSWPMIEGRLIGVSNVADQHARDQEKATGTPEIAEDQEQRAPSRRGSGRCTRS